MRFNYYYGRINWRAVSIGIGVISTILWIVCACSLTISKPPINWDNDSSINAACFAFSTFICSLANSAASALLVYGVKKGIANYTFPWLAIHFVFIMFAIPLSFYMIVTHIESYAYHYPYSIIPRIPMILLTVAVTFSWAIVYQYCKSMLVNTTQVQPASPEKDKSLEVSSEPINPYHPV